MTELAVSVRLKADGSGLVGPLNQAKGAVDQLGRAAADAGEGARKLGADSAAAGQAATALAGAAKQAGAATGSMAGEQREAAAASSALGASAVQVTTALGQLGAANERLLGELVSAQAATAQATAALGQLGAAHERLRGELAASQATTAALRTDLDAARQAMGALGARVATLETQLAGAGRGAAELDAATRAVIERVDPARAAVDRLNAELDQARKVFDAGRISAEQFAGEQARVAAAIAEVERGSAGNIRSLGQQKAGYFQLGQQLQDVGIQLSMGTDVMRVAALQGGQLATAIDMIGPAGAAGRVARFFAGPWGAVILTATAVLGPWVAKLFEGDKASGELEKKTLSLHDALQRSAFATDEARKALQDYNDAQKRAREGDSLRIDDQLRLAEAQLKTAQATRQNTLEQLRQAEAKFRIDQAHAQAPGHQGEFASLVAGVDAYQLGQIQALLAKNTADAGQLEQAIRNLRIEDARGQAERAVDPLKRLNDQYDRMRDRAIRAAQGNDQLSKSLAGTLTGIERQRKPVALQRQPEQDQAASRESRQGPLTAFLSPVSGGRVTGRFGEARPGHLHAGVDFAVPVGTPVRAPAAGTVDVAGQRQGYGNAIYINFGGGTSGRFGHLSRFNVKPGDVVEAGDVIGYTGGAPGEAGAGRSTGPHLHYEVRRGGRAVDPLAARFRTDAGSAADDADRQQRQAEQAAERIARQQEQAAERLTRQAEQARQAVDGISGAWGGQPKLIERARVDTAKLDALITDLARKKPPGFEQLIRDAQTAKQVIADGVERPFNDFVAAQRDSHQIGKLILEGHAAEAQAQQQILEIERERGPLSQAQRDAVVAVTAAMREQEQQIDRMRERQQVYLSALDDTRQLLLRSISEGAGSIEKLPGRLFQSFKRFASEKLFDDLFGDTFARMRREIEEGGAGSTTSAGVSRLFDAKADQLGTTVDQVGRDFSQLGDAAATVADALRASAAPPAAAAGGEAGFGVTRDAQGRPYSDFLERAAKVDLVKGGYTPDAAPTTKLPQKREPLGEFYGRQITESLKSVGISDDAAKKIGGFTGKGLAGAFQGQQAAGFANMLGIKTNSTGAALGGAIGSFIPGLGPVLGGVLGGVIGNLFGKRVEKGSATIGDTSSKATTAGNNRGLEKAAAGLASNVQTALAQVADQLGGTVGSFAPVTIGKRGESYKVNTTGAATLKKGRAGVVDFDEDEGAAVAFAIRTALERGAVQGLSAAVAKALQSSDDVEKAVAEAVKVSELETLLGGVTGQLGRIFKDYDREAAQRVELAKKYGLDVLRVEQINAEKRADLLEQTLKERVGSLKDLLSNLQYGDLFEGDASTRRSAILGEIADAKGDADAGVEGAADRLAELYRQLVTTSKEAFGTAGPEYANDRDAAVAGVQRVIQIETDRVNAAAEAQKATTAAVQAGNALADEGNDLAAASGAKLDAILSALTARGVGVAPDLALTSYRTL